MYTSLELCDRLIAHSDFESVDTKPKKGHPATSLVVKRHCHRSMYLCFRMTKSNVAPSLAYLYVSNRFKYLYHLSP